MQKLKLIYQILFNKRNLIDELQEQYEIELEKQKSDFRQKIFELSKERHSQIVNSSKGVEIMTMPFFRNDFDSQSLQNNTIRVKCEQKKIQTIETTHIQDSYETVEYEYLKNLLVTNLAKVLIDKNLIQSEIIGNKVKFKINYID
jgi:hypothetical protein